MKYTHHRRYIDMTTKTTKALPTPTMANIHTLMSSGREWVGVKGLNCWWEGFAVELVSQLVSNERKTFKMAVLVTRMVEQMNVNIYH